MFLNFLDFRQHKASQQNLTGQVTLKLKLTVQATLPRLFCLSSSPGAASPVHPGSTLQANNYMPHD